MRPTNVVSTIEGYIDALDDLTPSWVNHGIDYLYGMALLFAGLFAGAAIATGAMTVLAVFTVSFGLLFAGIAYDEGLNAMMDFAWMVAVMVTPIAVGSYLITAEPTRTIRLLGGAIAFLGPSLSMYLWGLYRDPGFDESDDQDTAELEVSV